MDKFEENNLYSTETHTNELDSIFSQNSEDFDEVIFKENKDLYQEFKTYVRFLRKKFSSAVKEKLQKNFTNILYITLDCPPFTPNSYREDSAIEYIPGIQKQYPDNDIRVLIPIINVEDNFNTSKKLSVEIEEKTRVLEKTSITFNFFLQNRIQNSGIDSWCKGKLLSCISSPGRVELKCLDVFPPL